MKKLTKALLMMSLCFAITGAAFCIVSVCMGFQISDLQAAVDAGQFRLAGPKLVSFDVNELMSDLTSGHKDFQQSYREVESLSLETGAAECRITFWDEAEWMVRGRNVSSGFSADRDGDWLTIDCAHSGLKFWEKTADAQLELYIPRDAELERVEMEAGVGEIRIEDGFLKCERLELQCGVGECDLYIDVKEKAEIEGGVGEVRLTLPGREEDYDYDLECGLGSMKIGTQSFSGAGVEHRIDHDTGKEIRVECGIGNVEILFIE